MGVMKLDRGSGGATSTNEILDGWMMVIGPAR
jgi:hypothetical protein